MYRMYLWKLTRHVATLAQAQPTFSLGLSYVATSSHNDVNKKTGPKFWKNVKLKRHTPSNASLTTHLRSYSQI